jgi:HD-like signal output (HDOD) protein
MPMWTTGGMMFRANEKVRVLFPEEVDASSSPSPEDSEAKQSRRLSLMASLSDGLPTLPAYVFELNSLLAATPVNLKRVGEVIRTDPSLSAQVIRLCNSAFLGFRERVRSIEHAVILLGTERLRTLILTCSLVEYAGHSLTSEDIQSFWQHCFLTAALGERLVRGIAYPQPEQAYIAGLLHDIGALPLLIISSSDTSKNGEVSSESWGESIPLERERFGTDHCEVGHWIGISWNFPPTLLEVMVSHHDPRTAKQDQPLVGVVAAADQFCVQRGVVLGAIPPELSVSTANPNQEILAACLPGLDPKEAAKLGKVLETDFLHLIQLSEFGAAGLFGGGIPKNPFRETEGRA